MRSSLTCWRASISEFLHKKKAQQPTRKRYLILSRHYQTNLRSSMKSNSLSSKWVLRLKVMTIKLRSSLKNLKAPHYISTTHSSRSALNFLILKLLSLSILSVLTVRPSSLKKKKLNKARSTPKKIKVTNTLSRCSHSTTTLTLSSKVTGRSGKTLNIKSCIHSNFMTKTLLQKIWIRLKSLFQSAPCGTDSLMGSLPFSTKILKIRTIHSTE